MVPIITSLIPPQNMEVIRDQVAAVIGVEMGNQHTINNAYPNIRQVWVGRFAPIALETECPTIIVNINKDDFSNETVMKTEGTIIFDIDIYTAASATSSLPADQASTLLNNKIGGMVRAILDYADYRTLGISPGIIGETTVLNYMIVDRGNHEDALSGVVGRIKFMVRCVEQTLLSDNSRPINELTTTIYLNGSEQGFYFDYRQRVLLITATGATLTDTFFTNKINSIDLLDINGVAATTYVALTDYTQTGTTITATTFSFTSGTKILART